MDAQPVSSSPIPSPPAPSAAAPVSSALLPVFFFHGVLMTAATGVNFATKMEAEGRHFVPLSFCSEEHSTRALKDQVPLAIAQIRAIVTGDARFDNGYVFIGFSLGSAIARAVILEMDDHNVKTFVSLAGPVNGVFFGPQLEDERALSGFLTELGPALVPSSVFDFTKYAATEDQAQYQPDFDTFVREHPGLQDQFAFINMQKSPLKRSWKESNKLLAQLNNLNVCPPEDGDDAFCRCDQLRRRANFLKLRAAHFFVSPDDGLISPWQSCILGRWSELDEGEAILTKELSASLHIVDMKDTDEYQQDTYGLKTLDERKGLVLHTLAGVAHNGWITDSDEFGLNPSTYKFSEVYEKHLQPLF